MIIRSYQPSDAPLLWQIFFHTIHNVNNRDYNHQQIEAWAPANRSMDDWQHRMDNINPFVAELDGEIVGYADVQSTGYIDHFFCHWQYQGKGIGKALINQLFRAAKKQQLSRVFCHASITAKPFFEHMGFVVEKQQQVPVRGQVLTNYVMSKNI